MNYRIISFDIFQTLVDVVYSDQQTPFARSFRSSITEGEIHPHGS
jgi:hypothetical protein